ncbi:MAG TPA: hypothetical protein VLT58_17855, partial [Polyangia bacterium]|nr:hypothetical protein [Polyangia bacterium]
MTHVASYDRTADEGAPSPSVAVALSPRGHVQVRASEGSDLAHVAKYFERGDGHGVFRLGAADPETIL